MNEERRGKEEGGRIRECVALAHMRVDVLAALFYAGASS